MDKKKLINLYKKESSNVFDNIPTKKIIEFEIIICIKKSKYIQIINGITVSNMSK